MTCEDARVQIAESKAKQAKKKRSKTSAAAKSDGEGGGGEQKGEEEDIDAIIDEFERTLDKKPAIKESELY